MSDKISCFCGHWCFNYVQHYLFESLNLLSVHKLQNLFNPQAINLRNCKLEIYVSANKHILIVNHLATQRLIIAGRWDRHARKMRSRCYQGIATVLALGTRHHLFFIFIWPRTYFTAFLFCKILTNESVRMD